MIANMYDTTLTGVIVAAKEIIMTACTEKAGGLERIAMLTDIGALVHADTVIHALGNREGGYVLSVMELHIVDVRREEQFIRLIYRYCSVFPPEERSARLRSVVHAHPRFKARLARRKADANHALHAVHGLVFAHPYGHGAALFTLNGIIHRHERGRTVMTRPVELYAARHP